MKNGKLYYRAWSFYNVIPVNVCINDILNSRILRITRLMNINEINTKVELLRYYPLASFALYEYFLRLTVYMLLQEEVFKNLYLEFLNKKLKKSFKQPDDKLLLRYHITQNQYYSMLLSYNKSSHSIELIEIVKNSCINLNYKIEYSHTIFEYLKNENTKSLVDWFNLIRNRFAHQSEIVDLSDFIIFQEKCMDLFQIIDLIKEIISSYYPNVFTHAINFCPYFP